MARPFIPVAYGVKAEFRYLVDGQQVENVLNFKGANAAGEAALITLGAALVAWWADNLKPLMSSYAVLQSIRLTALDSSSAPSIVYNTGLPQGGGVTGGVLPNNVSLAIKTATAARGRNATGRMFLAGLPISKVDTNVAQGAWRDLLKTAFEALITESSVAGWVWVVASYVISGAFRNTGVTAPITAVTVDPTVDSQRRRLPGRGR